MKTMGQHELWLVSPRSFPHPEATAMAAGAADVLETARVVPSLLQAVADCGLVLGTSARIRTQYHWPVWGPQEAVNQLQEASLSGPVAVVFGTERTGLTNEEFELCHGLIHSPVDPNYESLNLAQAVQIIAYEAHRLGHPQPQVPARAVPLSTVAELHRLYAHVEAVMTEVGFTDRYGGPNLQRRVERILGRAVLDQHETNILRGFLAAVQAKVGKPDTSL
jgi:TrmH family RNA methyltransferase